MLVYLLHIKKIKNFSCTHSLALAPFNKKTPLQFRKGASQHYINVVLLIRLSMW